jgi:hypothetical protein
LLWDETAGCWRHLDDLSRCDPGQPRAAHRRPVPASLSADVFQQIIAHLSRPGV